MLDRPVILCGECRAAPWYAIELLIRFLIFCTGEQEREEYVSVFTLRWKSADAEREGKQQRIIAREKMRQTKIM